MQTINTTRFLVTEYLRLSQGFTNVEMFYWRLIEVFRNHTLFGKYQ